MESSLVASEIQAKTHYVGKVLKIGLAGILVDIGTGQSAGLHVSQIATASGEPVRRLEDAFQVGNEIEVWVKKVKDGRVELTMIKPLDLDWRDLKKDMVVKGKVVRLEKFGAFIEIGAERPGLVHISEMAHGYVREPSDVLKEGDEVEAQVLEVNRRKKQIKLSLKALQPEPVKDEVEARPASFYTDHEVKDKPRRRKKSPTRRSNEDSVDVSEFMVTSSDAPQDETDTALGSAIRDAMERAQKRRLQEDKAKKAKALSKEQEDILSRTLEQRAPTA